MNLIKSLKKISTENEFKNQFENLIFKEAKNKEEANNYPYIQIPKTVTSIEETVPPVETSAVAAAPVIVS